MNIVHDRENFTIIATVMNKLKIYMHNFIYKIISDEVKFFNFDN